MELEILAPAGNAECAKVAINSGANAIYLGYSAFSARQNAENFNLEELLEIIKIARLCGVSVYVAMNTMVKESETEEFIRTLLTLWNMGVNAVILQDALLGKAIKARYPEIVLHLSTQAGVCTENGARFAKDCGFSRVILARETPLEEIEKITLGTSHGGIVAVATKREIPSLDSLSNLLENGFYCMIEGIEDPYNFGYTVRSLYAAGVTGIVLPPRNWMTAAGTVARASAGTSEQIPMFVSSSDEVADLFHSCNYQILCAGIRDSVSVFEERFQYPILLVIGGEKRGISRNLLNSADQIVRIDYGRSFRGSLCASAAAAILAFSIYQQNKGND